MLICKLSDQLGNQMFAYAAIKSIAKDKGYDFYVHDEYDNQFLKNDTDKRLGCNLTTIFENVRKEVIHDIPTGFNEFQEITTTKSPSSFQKEALQVEDNTVMKGHYISPLYFEHRLNEVQEWFKFPELIEKETLNILNNLRKKYTPDTLFCSVHFRNALDYRVKGYMLSKHYWEKAAKELLKQNKGKNIVFILFYDKMSKLIKKFSQQYRCEIIHNSLINDFDLISKCDFHIVCNSSFSVMAALMDRKSNSNTYCPSIWPVGRGYFPVDAYPYKWVKVSTKRNFYSYLLGYIAPYLSPLKHIIRKS